MNFDATDWLQQAARNPAQGPSTSLFENLAAHFDVARGEDWMTSEAEAVREQYDERNDLVFELTGERLRNPYHFLYRVAPKERERLVVEDEVKLGAIRRRFPNVDIPTLSDMWREIADERRATRERHAGIAARQTFLGGVGDVLGGMAGAMLDPPVLATMAAGAPAAAGILRTAAIEGGMAAVGTAITAPARVRFKARIGSPYATEDALADIGLAALGGGVAGAAIKGAALGGRELVRLAREGRLGGASAVRNALSFLSRKHAMEDTSPYAPGDRAGATEHARRFDDTLTALREDAAPEIADVPAAVPGRVRSFGRRRARRNIELPTPTTTAASRAAAQAQDEALAAQRRAIDELAADDRAREAAFADARLAGASAAAEARHVDVMASLKEAEAAGTLAELLTYARTPPKGRPRSLVDWAVAKGGLREDKGELKAIGLTARTRPGLLNNRSGMTLDDAALRATEDGFFPHAIEGRATWQDFVSALDAEINGRGRRIDPDDEALAAEIDNWGALRQELDDAGIDLAQPDDAIAGSVRGFDLDQARARMEALAAFDAEADALRLNARLVDDEEAGMLADEEATMLRLREELAEEPDIPFILGDGDDTRTVTAGALLEELDGDDAFLGAAKGCLS